MELETVQALLLDAGIEVDLAMLHNPTEDFMIYVVTEYLKIIKFDGDEIAKPTPKQLECISCQESASQVIKAINLHAALSSICDKIFVKDFTLTDIMSTGSKRACKRIKVLFNFVAYARSKWVEKESVFEELNLRHEEILDLEKSRDDFIVKTEAVIQERNEKLALKDKLSAEIETLRKKMMKDEEENKKLHKIGKEMKEKLHSKSQNHEVLKSKVHKIHKSNIELQSKVIKSPEELTARSNELKLKLDGLKIERQELQESINMKKSQIQNYEVGLKNVQEDYQGKIKHLEDCVQKIKEFDLQIKDRNKQLMELKKEIKMIEENSEGVKINAKKKKNDNSEDSQRLLSELDNMYEEKKRGIHELSEKLKELKIDRDDAKIKIRKELDEIVALDKDLADLTNACKDYCGKEITEVTELENYLRLQMLQR